jgi:2-keto-4-pentenoate hydratase/2-oxohepta-3-ene-1,7-dioic acid hydratase in catechol pathway
MKTYGRALVDGAARWLEVDGGEARALADAPWTPGVRPVGFAMPAAGAVTWLAPIAPRMILALGRTYAEHAKERGYQPPAEPLLFLKPVSSLLASGGDVVLPRESAHVEFEGELALVVSRRVRRFPADGDPAEVVFGCLVADDVSARDLQKSDGQWARAKGFDTFCPVGPFVRPGLPAPDARLRTLVDGVVRQDAPLSQMSFPLARLLAHATSAITLEPGDEHLTGNNAGV